MKTAITSLMALMVSLTITLAGSNGQATYETPNGTVTGNGNGTQVWHYTQSYNDYFFGQVTCTGVHQQGKNFGTFGQDSFTCTAQPAGAALQNVIPNETLTSGIFGGWQSDYWVFLGYSYLATAFNGVVSSDATSYTAVARY
jgi:hypothetical protein